MFYITYLLKQPKTDHLLLKIYVPAFYIASFFNGHNSLISPYGIGVSSTIKYGIS